MSIRNGQNLGMRHYFQKTLLDETTSEMLAAILPQYYLRNPIPKELIVHPKIDGVIELTRIFSEKAGRKVIIKSNVRDYRAQWLEMALLNTTENLDRHLASKDAYTTRLKQLSTALGLAVDPVRLECFDISHTAGEATVGACVVFDAEGPVSSQYRRFNMKSVEAGDDYGAMREVLQRRYRKVVENQEALPDLVLVDGGKGQYRIAHEVLNELLLGDIPIVAVAKGRDRKPGNEKLYISRRNSVLSLPGSSAGLHLIQQIRDEAHRFAITGHRQRRAKRRTYSTLQDVPGIGAIRRRALLKYFGGLQQLKRAPVEDLIKVAGISNPLAEKIYHFLRQD
jgi:excinuclease ABC subunit C